MLKIGDEFNIAITACGGVYSWGSNYSGQLGLGNNDDQNVPQPIEFFKDKQIKKIICGEFHTFAITEIGEVYSWGYNGEGQLGLGHNNDQNIPQQVDFFKDKQIKEIKCGGFHTIAITEIGDVYSWGRNNDGQLGLGHNNNQNIPQLVEFFKDRQIKKIICGNYNTFAIIGNGNVYSWGWNNYGQLGLGHDDDQNIPQLVESFKDKRSCMLQQANLQIKKIICGCYYTYAITEIGDLYSWGCNTFDQLGPGHHDKQNIPQQVEYFKDKQIREIKCGEYHTIAITNSGDIYSWGNNLSGQLGLGHNDNQKVPQLVDFFRDKQIKIINCGARHTFAITEIGDVYSWGRNRDGQLGLGHGHQKQIYQNIPQLVEFFKEHPIITRISNVKSAKSATFNS